MYFWLAFSDSMVYTVYCTDCANTASFSHFCKFCTVLSPAQTKLTVDDCNNNPKARTMSNASQQRPVPTTPELRERIINTARAVPKKKIDKTYEYEIKKYKTWVDEQNLERHGKYLTRENVDLYFAEVQKDRLVTVNTGRRVVSALQSYAKNVEYAGDAEGFTVESNTVKQMLEAQKQQKNQRELDTIKDYHVKLCVKNLTYMEKGKIVRYVLKEKKLYWSDFTTCWTACNQMFTRVDAMRKFKINDLYIDTNHSAGNIKQDNENPFDHQMITIILRPLIHKERFDKAHVIGAYRHRDPYMCFTGCLAMNLFVLLNTEKFNFHDEKQNIDNNILSETDRRNKKYVEPKWSQTALIRRWTTHKGVDDSYREAMKANDIEWEKCTHLRKSGIEGASAGGLDAQSIGTMSKHNSERGSSKMTNTYFTELYPPVLLWASGYDKNDIYTYNNPRTRLEMPNDYINILFPQLHTWKAEQASELGDKRTCTMHFLGKVIPFLAMVVIQDGIYWSKDYPNNEASRLLLSMMPLTYPKWALDARQRIRNQAKDVAQVQVDNLNGTAQRAFNLMISVQEQHHQQANQQLGQILQQLPYLQQLVHVQQQMLLAQGQHQQSMQQMMLVQQQQQQSMQEMLQAQQEMLQAQQQMLQTWTPPIPPIIVPPTAPPIPTNTVPPIIAPPIPTNIIPTNMIPTNMIPPNMIPTNTIPTNTVLPIIAPPINAPPIIAPPIIAPLITAPPIPTNIVPPMVPPIAPIAPIYQPPPAIAPIAPIYQPPPARLITTNYDTIIPIVPLDPRLDINNVLRGDPTVPFIPPELPKTLHDLVEQHYQYHLITLKDEPKRHWQRSVQTAYSKRKHIFEYIYNKATRVRGAEDIKTKTINTAIAMDRDERGVLTVNQFAQFILQNSTTRKKRNRRQQPQLQPPQQQQRITNYIAPMDGILPQDPDQYI